MEGSNIELRRYYFRRECIYDYTFFIIKFFRYIDIINN